MAGRRVSQETSLEQFRGTPDVPPGSGTSGVTVVRGGSRLRAATWLLHMALPILALWLLVAQPELDLAWDHRMAHFGLVLATAAVSVALGVLMGRAARSRDDARLWLVSLVFVISAGFLGLHALVTPGVLLETSNLGFALPTRMGLLLAAVAALASSVEFTPARTARLRRLRWHLSVLVWALLAVCGVVVVVGLPLGPSPDPAVRDGAAVVAAVVSSVLYAAAALRYLRIYRQRPGVVLMSVLTAFVLLAEASLALAFGRSWQASWWLWHVLMMLAFCFIAYSAHIQFRREGSARGLFDSLATQQTLADLRRDYAAAMEAMVDVLHRRERGEEVPLGAVTARLAARFDLTEQQVAVLERGAQALAAEREQVRKLGGLIAVGREVSVIQEENTLLARVMVAAADAFYRDELRLGLVRAGELGFAGGAAGPLARRAAATLEPAADATTLALPLVVKGRAAGVIEAHRPRGRFADAEVALLSSFASQVSIALENARLYHQLDGLFRSYMSPAVATALVADPEQAGLGGAVVEVTVLMADLRGFTPFSEATSPDQVVALLNTYYGAVVPVILDAGGTIVQFVGDAVMAIWGAPVRQPDHALRAARAGLALHDAVEEAAAGHADWPRFRIGINTGPALVGNIGAPQMRNYAAIGDTTNVAARLEGLAEPGQVVLGPNTRASLGAAARVTSRGSVPVKGKRDPVALYLLHELAER